MDIGYAIFAVKKLWWRLEHRVHYLRNREFHVTHCTCHGTGRFT